MYTVTGELSHDNASAVAAAGLSAIAAGQSAFDLSALTKIDSSAVAVLIAWQRQAMERGMQLQFSGYSANLLSLLTLYGLNEQFQLHPSERH